ncbi:interferon alpha-inducible protein 27-like protein 2 isoform X3 [Hippoglossus stenolepis]|uniref:interferon alpha-inducible protein 27-like protein 2 isoform X2 n=1 Tax=Hippoglossus stenolepis TaxID=195615 RepID=UPI00159C0300|nr:interferon alpha-inducible protein 27-like protein 2 isoform X2 [Hippoglossus stenolepis]XP_047197637.1 interferon alpha-inducible protein 27-like protein 2 isoform X1 [Hippoglossus stenolepis]XP_047197638.1 interferon alpha-inducible protein 27-like protein 2 isoform X3 [Hippoglossus stenolepis]
MDPVTSAAVGAAGAQGSTPKALGAAGFTSGGIAAGSTAAKMMSASAVASGGRVGAGSLVSACQSKGASGASKGKK